MAAQNFTPISARGWECDPPKVENFHFLAELPHRVEPFGQFQQLLGALIRPITLHLYFTFWMICITAYGVIAEKLRISHLPRNFPCTM